MSATSNGEATGLFLASVDPRTREQILESIASDYGITVESAFEEITSNGAENLLDYLSGSIRLATSLLIKQFWVRSATPQHLERQQVWATTPEAIESPVSDNDGASSTKSMLVFG